MFAGSMKYPRKWTSQPSCSAVNSVPGIKSIPSAWHAAAISAHASSVSVSPNRKVTLSVSANGTSPFTYQWVKDGAGIVGATNSTYVVTRAQAQDSGNYVVVVYNSAGSTVSDIGTLKVAAVAATDFNGDYKSDILWTNTSTGERSMWLMSGNTSSGGSSLGLVPVQWAISGRGDFNGDGISDIIWTNTSTGDRAIWQMNGSAYTNLFVSTIPVSWAISGTGDFNGDGKADIFWTNTATGDRAVWLMNGNTAISGGYLGSIPVEWVVGGIGDFNGDG